MLCPFSESGLDEALRLAVGGRGVRASEAVFDVLLVEGFAEAPVAVAASVIGEQAADGDAETGVVSSRHEEEAYGGAMGLIGQDGGEADAGVVVDSDVQILPAGAA